MSRIPYADPGTSKICTCDEPSHFALALSCLACLIKKKRSCLARRAIGQVQLSLSTPAEVPAKKEVCKGEGKCSTQGCGKQQSHQWVCSG